MEFNQFGEMNGDHFGHHHAITKISPDVPEFCHAYFLGRERVNESTQSYNSSRSLYVRIFSVSIQNIITSHYANPSSLSYPKEQFSLVWRLINLNVSRNHKPYNNMIQGSASLILLLCWEIQASHLYWRSHHVDNHSSNAIGILFFFFLVCGCIAYAVYRCRRRNAMRAPPPLLPLPPQPPIYRPNRQLNPYLGFQTNNFPIPNNRYNSAAAPRLENDVTRAANQSLNAQKWSGPDYFAQRRLRENCSFCNSYSRYGEEPRILMSCPQHHAFHIACLNQYQVNRNRSMSCYDGQLTCPTCCQPTSDRVRYCCQACKQNYMWVELSKFRDQDGVIDTTALLNEYGGYCSDCRN